MCLPFLFRFVAERQKPLTTAEPVNREVTIRQRFSMGITDHIPLGMRIFSTQPSEEQYATKVLNYTVIIGKAGFVNNGMDLSNLGVNKIQSST